MGVGYCLCKFDVNAGALDDNTCGGEDIIEDGGRVVTYAVVQR